MSTLKIKRENGKIFCPLADSWHIETPEEKVRQEYIKILVENYSSINRGINNAPAFRLQFSKIEKQVRVCEFSNRTLLLLLHLPLKIVQRLDMPEAFAGDGTEGQRTEKVD